MLKALTAKFEGKKPWAIYHWQVDYKKMKYCYDWEHFEKKEPDGLLLCTLFISCSISRSDRRRGTREHRGIIASGENWSTHSTQGLCVQILGQLVNCVRS